MAYLILLQDKHTRLSCVRVHFTRYFGRIQRLLLEERLWIVLLEKSGTEPAPVGLPTLCSW